MSFLYCTKGHQNPKTHNFCQNCGEKLSPVSIGQVINKRYHILRQLGQGGFGKTYLAEDKNRYDELCVLKEFSPQITGQEERKKAEELFAREADVLYKLEHDQIPKFREICSDEKDGKQCLFLVQNYVEGETYRQLLNKRGKFQESEILLLLQQILPVLQYIHGLGVIHRDISPENIILRASDQLPVLIDFGGVKTAAISANIHANQPIKSTHIGKPGYAPEEQLQQGRAYPSSDLYSLAVTAIVLLTGKEPKELYDTYHAKWQWQKYAQLSPQLTSLFNQMIARNPGDRYQTAREVLETLPGRTNLASNTQMKTLIVAPANPNPPTQTIANPQPPRPPITLPRLPWPVILAPLRSTLHFLGKTTAWGAGIFLFVVLGAWAGPKIIAWKPPFPPTQPTAETTIDPVTKRLQTLKINSDELNRLVDQEFHQRHPELKGRKLTKSPADAQLRQEWLNIEKETLAKLEQRSNL